MSGGIQNVPLRIPEKWSASWFADFVRVHLANADVRNAVATPSVIIGGTPDTPGTITVDNGDASAQIANRAFLPPPPSSLPSEAHIQAVKTFLPPPQSGVPIADIQSILAIQIFGV